MLLVTAPSAIGFAMLSSSSSHHYCYRYLITDGIATVATVANTDE